MSTPDRLPVAQAAAVILVSSLMLWSFIATAVWLTYGGTP